MGVECWGKYIWQVSFNKPLRCFCVLKGLLSVHEELPVPLTVLITLDGNVGINSNNSENRIMWH